MKKLLYLVPMIALLAFGCNSASKPAEEQTSKESQNQTSPQPAPTPQTPNDGGMTESGSMWMGTLKASDNSKKGNLMLVTKDTTIYIKTSRDYKALIGKNVHVTYTGSLENFTLGDIVAQ